jgi:hypothetical protein
MDDERLGEQRFDEPAALEQCGIIPGVEDIELKAEARELKETLAEVLIENRLLKKSVLGDGEDAS